MQPTKKFKINGMPSDKKFASMPFVKQIEFRQKIEEFKANAKSVHISQKRKTNAKAIREAIELYGAKEYYCVFYDTAYCRDDSFEFWYKS